jgi:hypothetical protein
MEPDEIRTELIARLGEPAIPDRVWEWLEGEGLLGAVMNGSQDLTWLVNRVVSFHEAAGSASQVLKSRGEVIPQAEQIVARSELLAHDARQRVEVQSFRREVLKGRLLKRGEVEAWIQAAAKADEEAGKPNGYITVPRPADVRVKVRKDLGFERVTLRDVPIVSLSSETLSYGVPEDQWMRRVVARYGGTLDRLRVLAESLEKEYQWPEALGTLFVLTDVTPLVSRIRRTLHGGSGRITLNIDVATVTPRQLAEFYGRTLVGLRRGRRIRALTDKHVRLAAFAVQRSEKPWGQRLTEWNKEFPAWGYTAESNFRRDALRAQRRLVEPAFSIADQFAYITDKPAPRLTPDELAKAQAEAHVENPAPTGKTGKRRRRQSGRDVK